MSLLEKSSSMELSRRTQPFYAKKGSYNLGEQVQIEVDVQREFLDFENSRLFFDLKFTTGTPDGTANSTKINKWGGSACVKNLRVKTLAGQMIGHEIREYRAWCRMYKELSSNSDLNDSYYRVLEAAEYSSGTATGWTAASAVQVQMSHKFMTHIFSIKEYYPAHFHQGIMIEFDIPSDSNELFNYNHADATEKPTSVTLENMKYVADLVQLKPEIENEMVQLMEQQRLFADYQEVLTQQNTIQSAGAGTEAYDLVGIDGRVKSVFEYSILAADQVGYGASSAAEFLGTRGQHNLNQYRFKLGANYLNYENIQVNAPTTLLDKRAEQVYELMKALDFHESNALSKRAGDSGLAAVSELNTTDNLVTNNFVVAVKVDKAQKDSNKTISSQVDKDRNNIRVELGWSASPGANATAYTHVVLDKRLQILPGSIVRAVRS
jgi:hypothetical protein